MSKSYKIIDIMYSERYGKKKYLQPKVGDKYDERRGLIIKGVENIIIGESAFFKGVNESYKLFTTKVEGIYPKDEYIYVVTENSVYKLKEV